MKKKITGTLCAGVLLLGIISSANAALLSRLSGQAIYDSDQDITWLANANLSATNTFGVSGVAARMEWDMTNEWVAAMNADGGTGYLGYNDWFIPTVIQPDNNCSSTYVPEQGGDTVGHNCSGSPMGHLYYVDGITTDMPGLFSNLKTDYFYGNEWSHSSDYVWTFGFSGSGYQGVGWKLFPYHVMVARPGDVPLTTVPIPPAVWLFGSGLVGLIGTAGRKYL